MQKAQAEDYLRWPTTNWRVGGRSVQARVAWWAGAWAGFTLELPGVIVVVVAHGIAPGAVRLRQVDDAEPYGVDLQQPLAFPQVLESSLANALGPDPFATPQQGWPLHPDHERLLQL